MSKLENRFNVEDLGQLEGLSQMSGVDPTVFDVMNEQAALFPLASLTYALHANEIREKVVLKHENGQLREQVMFDPATGARSKAAFWAELPEVLSHSRRSGEKFSAWHFDLDDFKQYNDKFGHEAGDEVIRLFAQTIMRVTRPRDHLYRTGGDEFMLLAPDLHAKLDPRKEEDAMNAMAEHMSVAVRAALEGTRVGVSMGVALVSPDEAEDVASIVYRADQAMYVCKRARQAGEDTIVSIG